MKAQVIARRRANQVASTGSNWPAGVKTHKLGDVAVT
jgi:hypothetical protein